MIELERRGGGARLGAISRCWNQPPAFCGGSCVASQEVLTPVRWQKVSNPIGQVHVGLGSSASIDRRSVMVCSTPDRHRQSGRARTPASCHMQTLQHRRQTAIRARRCVQPTRAHLGVCRAFNTPLFRIPSLGQSIWVTVIGRRMSWVPLAQLEDDSHNYSFKLL